MGIELRLPNIKGNDKEQLVQIRSYLYQLAEQLQWALNNIDTSSSNYVAPQAQRTAASAQAFTNIQHMVTPKIDSTATDFVTDIGVWNVDDSDPDKGYWSYRKWKSGAIDMNGLIKVAPVTEGQLGTAGVYYSEVIYLDLPFEVVNFQFTGSSTSYHCFVGNCNSVDGNNKQVRLRLYRFTDFASLADYNVYVRIVASGKLK
jgi:hypothetical protein